MKQVSKITMLIMTLTIFSNNLINCSTVEQNTPKSALQSWAEKVHAYASNYFNSSKDSSNIIKHENGTAFSGTEASQAHNDFTKYIENAYSELHKTNPDHRQLLTLISYAEDEIEYLNDCDQSNARQDVDACKKAYYERFAS